MPGNSDSFEIDDAATFDDNLTAFGTALSQLDPALGPILQSGLPDLLAQKATRADLLNALFVAASKETPA